ncbi:MAG: heme-binding protein [Kiritimatiellae bacterium]|nr:heme-binding protein [Kiritimatiellia bacterium]
MITLQSMVRRARPAATGLAAAAGIAAGVEQLDYEVLSSEGPLELRRYNAHVVAELEVEGDLESAGNIAFRPLYRFITGHNRAGRHIPMTAPVVQTPVTDARWRVAFVMPSGSTLDHLPQPADERVRLRVVPLQWAAAIRYSGRWSRDRFETHRRRLEAWVAANGWTAVGPPVWARYDPPLMPWFLRRNEIWLPLAEPSRPPARPRSPPS